MENTAFVSDVFRFVYVTKVNYVEDNQLGELWSIAGNRVCILNVQPEKCPL